MYVFLFKYEDGAERDLKMLTLMIEVMQPQAKKCCKLPEAGKSKEGILP